jgi:Cu(I)/Ag(I) efflux system membrane fusion protein
MGISRRSFLGGVAVAGLAGLAGYATTRHGGPTAAVAKRIVYTCSMHPQVRQDHPGACPICNMKLVPVSSLAAAAAAPAGAHVPLGAQQAGGVRTARATYRTLAKRIDAFASISADDSATVAVSPKVEGWLRSLAVHGPGQAVRRGQVLYEIYSPELQQRQRDYIDLLTRKDGLLADSSMSIAGVNAAMAGSLAKEKFRNRARLLAAGMDDALVDTLEQTRRVIDVVPVRAEHDGVVTAVGAHEGNFVNPMQQILSYADLRTVWAELTLYPDQLAWVRNGDPLVLRSSLDGRSQHRTRVDLSTLQVDPASRTARLRVRLRDSQGAFRPGAFADASIEAAGQRALCVPRAALIRTGHGDYVLVAHDKEHFRRVPVSAGVEDDQLIAVRGALREGDLVAIDAQFLVDGALALQAPGDHDHAGQP